MTRNTSSRTRFASIILALALVMNLVPFSAFATKAELGGDNANAELTYANGQISDDNAENTDKANGEVSDENAANANAADAASGANTASADGESASVPVASYTVSIALPGQGVALADGQSKQLLAQTVSAGSAMESICLVSTYADEPFDESMAGAFNSRLLAGTGLTAKCDANGVITISGTPTANVAVDLADAFAEDAPATVADATTVDTSAISVSVDNVTTDNESNVGTLSENLTATLNITDKNNYAVDTTPTYKFTVTNGRDVSGNVTATTGEDGTTKYTVKGLKYGDHVKVYVDGEDVPAAYFKVLNTSLENGSFENVSAETDAKKNYQRKTGIGIAAWHTTASDQNMEVDTAATYENTLSPDSGNVAELNALEASSLYQEISTTPGSTLGWTMYHTARTNYGSNTQKMAIVIGPALDAVDSDPYKKSGSSDSDMFMTIAAQIQNPVVGETYYTEYNGKTYQVTIASDAKQSANNNIWTQYSSTYTVPGGQTETVFAFASIDTTSTYKAGGNLIDGVGFGTGVAITQAKAAKNTSDANKIDISIENSTKNGVYVVLDKDMKPVTGKELTGGEYVTDGNGTFKLTSSDDDVTTVSMAALEKAGGPYTVMRVMSGTLSLTDGKASTANLTDIATVNIVNFAGDGVSWSDGATKFENGGYDIVTVPHDDQTGKATKTYTATAKNGYALAAENPVTGKLDNGESTAVAVTATTNEDGSKAFSVIVPAYGTTSKGTTNYNTVTLTGVTTISTGVKLKNTADTDSADMTVTDGVASKTYDGAVVARTDGSVDGATLSYTWQKKSTADGSTTYTDLTTAPSDAGDYNLKITATKTDGTTSTELGTEDLPFTISPKALTVTATAQDKTYDGKKDATLKDAALNGMLGADKDKVTLVTSSVSAAFGDKKVGTGKPVTLTGSYTLSGTAAGNYTVTQPTELTANITAKEVAISGLSATKTYDGDNTAEKSEITGTPAVSNKPVESDDVSVDTTNMTGTFNSADADKATTVTITGLSLAGNDAANYKLPQTVTCTGAITKASGNGSVKLEGWTYGEAAKTPQPTSTTNDTASVTYQYKGKGADDNTYSDTVPTKAGDYTVKATFAATNNYNQVTATADFAIAKKTLAMTATAQGKIYDGNADATVNAELDKNGVVGADDVSLDTTGVTASFDTEAAGEGKPVTVSGEYKLSGAAAGNYTMTQPSGLTAKITKKALTATISAESKTYDGNATAKVTPSLEGVVGNDDVAANASNPVFADKGVGEGKTVTAAIALSGTAAGNYTVNAEATTTASISAREVSITGVTVEASKTYDKSTAAKITSNGTINGKVETDDLAITVGTASYDDSNAGMRKAVSFTGFGLTGGDAGNYKLTGQPTSVTADITARELTVTATASDKVYDGKTEATVTNVVLSGAVEGDSVSLNQGSMTAAFEDANVGTGKTVTVSGLSLDNNENGNYKLPASITATANITQADGSGSVKLDGWTYGDEANAPTANGTTNPGSESSPITYQYKAKDAADSTYTDTVPSDAGEYTVKATFPANTNYTAATATTEFTISPKALTVNVAAANKEYDGTANATLNDATLDGVVDADANEVTLETSGVTAAFDNKNVGTDKPVTLTGSYALSGDAAKNYTVAQPTGLKASITAASLTITGATVTAKTYNGNDGATITSVTFEGLKNGETLAANTDYTVSDAKYDHMNATGDDAAKKVDFKVTLADTDRAKNYTLTTEAGSQDATIGKASHDNDALSTEGNRGETNTFGDLSAHVVAGGAVGDNITVNDANGILDGTPSYDSATGKLSYALKSTATESQTATVTLPVTSANYSDYSIVVTVGVTPKETAEIGITAGTYEYNGSAQAPTDITVTGDKVPVDTLEITYKSEDGTAYPESTTAPTNAGKYVMTAKVPDENTKYTGSVTCSFEITKKALTATISADNKTYDGSAKAAVTPKLDGVVEGDSGKVTADVANPAFDGKNVGAGKKVTAAIALSGTAAGNYTVNATAETTATISAREVSITGVTVANSKTYDRSASATPVMTNAKIDGKVEADNLSITVGNAAYDNANVGTNKTVTFTGFALEGADANNYKLKEQPASITADITAKEVTASITAESKVFDGTTAAEATSTLTGAVDGDVVFAKITGAEFADANVADGKQVTAAIELAGDAAANYSANKTATANANITAKALTLTIKANDKKLDGSDVAVLDTENAALDGMVSGHLVSVGSAKGSFENYNTASDAASVNVTDVKLEGEDAGNYEITKINSVTAKLIPLYVTFMDGDAKLDEKTISVYGTAPTDVVSPEKSGYNFAGWYTDEECTAPWNSKAGVTADTTVYAKWSTDALYTLSGVVKQGDAAKSDVAVTLYEGSVGIATATTDANGMYSFGNVPNGIYTITAKASDRAATTTVTVQDGDITQDIVLPATAVATEVQVAPGAPAATVSGIDESLVNALIASDGNNVTAPKEGERLEVKLNVKADASDAEKAAIQEKENENTSWDFVNMDVDWSKYNHLEDNIGSGNIADTVNVLAIRVPYDRDDKRDIVVYRHHMNGDAVEVTQFTQLQSEPDEASYKDGTCYVGDDYIMLYTQKFSAFGIGYIADTTDPKIEGAEDGKTYCGPVTLTITDDEIAQVTVNGKEVSLDADGRLTLNPADGKQTVVAEDAARNSTSITVTVNDGHTWGAWVSNGDRTHSHACTVDAAHTETADCSGGTATCSAEATCELCGGAYGEVDPSNHAALKHVDAKAATTDAEGNIEYWYCGDCGKYYKDANATEEIAKADTAMAKLTKEAAKTDTETTKPAEEPAKADTASAKPKSAGTSSTSASTSKTAAKTGDEIPVIPWAALLLASGGAGALASLVGRKRKRDR